jgi:hypothetical protein
VGHGSGFQAAPGHEEYARRDQLQTEADGHGGLMRLGRVAPSVGRPQGDDEAREALQAERGAHVEDAEGGVGAAGHLLGKALRQDDEAEGGGGTRAGDHGEQQVGRHRKAEQQGELGGHRQGEHRGEDEPGRDAGAAQALGDGSQQQGARGEGGCHQGEVPDDGGPVEPRDVGEPGRRPQALQRERRADAQGRQGGDPSAVVYSSAMTAVGQVCSSQFGCLDGVIASNSCPVGEHTGNDF